MTSAMCGIAGVHSPTPIQESILLPLLNAIRHRGPDDQGSYLNPNYTLALAHARLSVLDLSSAGHQPMSNETCAQQNRNYSLLRIVYNGEIYNYRALREELVAKGHRFSSQTDTEVILHLYEEEGLSGVQRLLGMFAFAIYDEQKRKLILVRDRLGIKPLYYAEHRGTFLFASEIKGILAAGMIPAEVNWQGISDYFTFGFVPNPQTAFQNIRALPPASTLELDLTSGIYKIYAYWSPRENVASAQPKKSAGALREELRALLTDAVKSELVSDVPLGVFFSGGIDSTLLAALMKPHASGKVQTFTVGFRGGEQDLESDLAYARLASRALGTNHHELMIDLTHAGDFLEVIRHFDQPFANPTAYLQYLIAQETRRHVTVALSGVGADELFGGYPRYRMFPWAGVAGAVPRLFGDAAGWLLGLIREDTWQPILRQTKRLLRGVGFRGAEQYTRWNYYLDEADKRRLLHLPAQSAAAPVGRQPSFAPASRIAQAILAAAPAPHADARDQFLLADLRTWLVDNLLEYTDKMSMAFALEVRVPFLDHRLVELAFQIPFEQKICGGQLKSILKETFADLLPAKIRHAPKRGFFPPIHQWIDQVFDRYFEETLTRAAAEKTGLFSWEAIQRYRALHRQRRANVTTELLAIISFDAWFRRHFASTP